MYFADNKIDQMSTIRREKLKPLVFSSYAELKEAGANMDRKVLFKLRTMDIQSCIKPFVEVEQEARVKNDEGDEEQAYIFYCRMMEVFRVINDKINEEFKRSPGANYFYDLSNRGFIALSELSEKLKSRFAELEKQKVMLKLTLQKIDKVVYINPKDIVQFLQKSIFNSVLVIDYRKDQSNSIEYSSGVGSGRLHVVSLDPEMIVYGCLLRSLAKALDGSVRPLLEQISHFGLVVLLGDLGDIQKGKGTTKTDILYEALTTYNIRMRLKRPPAILEGGFNRWELVYPFYVVAKIRNTFDKKILYLDGRIATCQQSECPLSRSGREQQRRLLLYFDG